MKCPHCLVDFHDVPTPIYLGKDADEEWALIRRTCPTCLRFILELQNGMQPIHEGQKNRFVGLSYMRRSTLVRPKSVLRAPCSPNVPPNFAEDYSEACAVLAESSKSAAALGRRCLQNLLRDVALVKSGNLADEIQQVIEAGKLPSDLNESIDAIRNIGNFAAHPMKSQHSGEILEVEPGEAEWTLDVLESLFDFYFVAPAVRRKKIEALNKKLSDVGKPPMK